MTTDKAPAPKKKNMPPPPPKGNKYALGGNGGRPPKYETKEELLVLGEEMLAWMEENKDNKKIVHLSQFYSELKKMDRLHWGSIRLRPEFLHYYNRALDYMASKTLTNDRLPTAYGSRYLAIYCKDLRDEERDKIRFEAEVNAAAKAKEVNNITEQEIIHNQRIIDGIMKLQQEMAKNEKQSEMQAMQPGDRE